MTATRPDAERGARPAGGLTGRPAAVVLTGRPARSRPPSATRWRLIEYDPATGLPVGDVADRWQPAGAPPPGGQPVNAWLLAWVTATLGYPAAVVRSADRLAGPSSWYVDRLPTPVREGRDA